MNAKKIVKFLSLSHQHDFIKNEVEKVFLDTLQRSFYILGPAVANFEKHYAEYTGSSHCVGVGNGLDALAICLKALGVGSGDEVIVPANTYHATWLAIANSGARIVPVEPDENTYTIDVTKITNSITKKTKVILPVHLYGQPCNMTALTEIANASEIKIVEDNAQAHGAKWMGKKTGSWGVVNATSFYPTKNLGALGDGGAVTTSDIQLADFVRTYRNYGSLTKNSADLLGVNSRLDELQAAFLSIKLKYLDQWNNERRLLAKKYDERLRGVSGIKTPFVDADAFHVYHVYVVQAVRRNELQSHLSEHGIETLIHYPVPPHRQKAYQQLGFQKENFPITELLADSFLSLPLWIGMTDQDIDYITDTIKKFYN